MPFDSIHPFALYITPQEAFPKMRFRTVARLAIVLVILSFFLKASLASSITAFTNEDRLLGDPKLQSYQ